MQFSYQFPERCERLVLVSSGGLGPDVGLTLRLATLPGSALLLSVAAPAARSLINVTASAGRTLRLRPAPDAEFYARTFAALADADTRRRSWAHCAAWWARAGSSSTPATVSTWPSTCRR